MSWCFLRDQIKSFFILQDFQNLVFKFPFFLHFCSRKKYCRICVCQMISKVIYKVKTPRSFQFWFYFQKQSKFNAWKQFHSHTKDLLFVFENRISWLLHNLIIQKTKMWWFEIFYSTKKFSLQFCFNVHKITSLALYDTSYFDVQVQQ